MKNIPFFQTEVHFYHKWCRISFNGRLKMVRFILVYMDFDMDDIAKGLHTHFDLAVMKQNGHCKSTEQPPPIEPRHGISDSCRDTLKCVSKQFFVIAGVMLL